MELFYEGSICKKDTGKFLRSFKVYKEGDVLHWQLTQGKQGIFNSCDFEILVHHHLRAQKDQRSPLQGGEQYYVLTNFGKEAVGVHRIIAGTYDTLITVDHKNRNGLDNRRENLRLATAEQQKLNKTRVGLRSVEGYSCEYRGVVYRTDCGIRPYRARACVSEGIKELGHFSNVIEAAKVWDSFMYDYYKDQNPLDGVVMNGVCGEPSVNFIPFNFPKDYEGVLQQTR